MLTDVTDRAATTPAAELRRADLVLIKAITRKLHPPRRTQRRGNLRLPGIPAPYRRKVIFNYGLGWDSTAILLRWLFEPESRDFELENLIVLVAQVGEEFKQTKMLVETYIFPLLCFFHIRTVQVARAGPSDKDGIVVLADTRRPTTLFIEGAWRLGDHLMRDGTVPQWGGTGHKCAQRFKAWPINFWLRKNLRKQPFRSIIGYNADELRRATKANDYADQQRVHEYPLIVWGWGRLMVESYVRLITGVDWVKSCCPFCPFSNGKAELIECHGREPDMALRALLMERLSLSLHPKMGLFPSGKTLYQLLQAANITEPLEMFEAMLDELTWAVYRVRRIWREQAPLVDRSVEMQAEGKREDMRAYLWGLGDVDEVEGIERVYVTRREGEERPATEEFFVAVPSMIQDKEKKCFGRLWADLTSGVSQLTLAL